VTISAAGLAPATASDHASSRENRVDDDRAHDGAFAEAFAGAMNAQHPRTKAPAPKSHDGASELDKSEARDDDDSTGTASAANGKDSDASAAKDANASTSDVIRSVAALDPQLQAKLAKVMARIRAEGHDVTVSETYRSQARQNVLFAQGRTAPGQVVTWTQSSKHTQGRAVDLLLDGGAAGAEAYGQLQQVANEEGLRTLGARDPGHLELPGSGDAATNATVDVTSVIPVEPAGASGPGQISIARIAQVAQVAQLAQVAQVAKPVTVGEVMPAGDAQNGIGAPTNGTVGMPITHNGVRAVKADVQNAAQQFSGDSGKEGGSSKEGGAGGYGALAAALAARDGATHTAVDGVATSSGTSAADRVAKVMQIYDDAPARPLSQITMNVDVGNGATDRIQLSMRGSSLNAAIDAADPRAAQAMSARSDELVRALSRDSITVDSLHIRAAAGVASTAAATASQQSSNNSNNQSRSERGNAWQQPDRQRSQGDRNDRRQQQREQRGGSSE